MAAKPQAVVFCLPGNIPTRMLHEQAQRAQSPEPAPGLASELLVILATLPGEDSPQLTAGNLQCPTDIPDSPSAREKQPHLTQYGACTTTFSTFTSTPGISAQPIVAALAVGADDIVFSEETADRTVVAVERPCNRSTIRLDTTIPGIFNVLRGYPGSMPSPFSAMSFGTRITLPGNSHSEPASAVVLSCEFKNAEVPYWEITLQNPVPGWRKPQAFTYCRPVFHGLRAGTRISLGGGDECRLTIVPDDYQAEVDKKIFTGKTGFRYAAPPENSQYSGDSGGDAYPEAGGSLDEVGSLIEAETRSTLEHIANKINALLADMDTRRLAGNREKQGKAKKI